MSDTTKPITQQADLAKLPRALAPLIERPQWCIWRWELTEKGPLAEAALSGTQPERHASTSDPSTWTTYSTALAAVQAGHGDGISYVLTTDDPFGAIDLDHCRCATTHSIDIWAQNWLDTGRNTYSEVTPSGEGIRQWGFADGDPVNKKYTLTIDDKGVAAELFRKTNKVLTVTGLTLDPAIKKLGRIDKLIGWGITWGERRKAAAQNRRRRSSAATASTVPARSTQSSRSRRLSAPAPRREPIAVACFTVWLAITWAAAGRWTVFSSTCRNTPTESAVATSRKIGCGGKSSGAPANTRSRSSCRCRVSAGAPTGRLRRPLNQSRSRRSPRPQMMILRKSSTTISMMTWKTMRSPPRSPISGCRRCIHTGTLIRGRSSRG